MNPNWHYIRNLGETRELRKTKRLFEPLTTPFNGVDQDAHFDKICGTRSDCEDEHWLCIGDAMDRQSKLGTFAERNAKKGSSCKENSTSQSSIATSGRITSSGSPAKSSNDSNSLKSATSPQESDGPESAGWERVTTSDHYWRKDGHRIMFKDDCQSFASWNQYGYLTQDGKRVNWVSWDWEPTRFPHWQQIDALLFAAKLTGATK